MRSLLIYALGATGEAERDFWSVCYQSTEKRCNRTRWWYWLYNDRAARAVTRSKSNIIFITKWFQINIRVSNTISFQLVSTDIFRITKQLTRVLFNINTVEFQKALKSALKCLYSQCIYLFRIIYLFYGYIKIHIIYIIDFMSYNLYFSRRS